MNTVDDVYGEEYFRSTNYADYFERKERYTRTAAEISDLLFKLGLLNKDTAIVDYGCALGFLVDGFHSSGYRAVGVDISSWARAEAEKRGVRVLASAAEVVSGDVLVALDVFEHMRDSEIKEVVETIEPKTLVVRAPVSTDGGKSFHLAVSRADKTHINCKTVEQWVTFFQDVGYSRCLKLNLY